MRVLVTDAANRVALAAARALAADGIDVTAAEQAGQARRTPLAFASRAVRRRIVLGGSAGDLRGEALADALLAASAGHDIILPIAVNTVLAVAARRDEFAARGVAVPLPPIDILRRANDKAAVAEAAVAAGVRVPRTARIGSLAELDRVAGGFPFPAVLKIGVDEGLYLAPGARYARVRYPEEAERALERLVLHSRNLVLQEAVEGTGYGYTAVCGTGGAVRAGVGHRRVREYPAGGGPSSCCESVREPEMEAAAGRLLETLGWTGVAMVEFRRDAEGRFWLLEVNPRFPGSLPLASACGVNLPALLCRTVLGGQAAPAPVPRRGVRVRWLVTDFFAAAGAGVGAAWTERGWLGFLRDALAPRVADGIFDRRDPRPGIVYVLGKAWSS